MMSEKKIETREEFKPIIDVFLDRGYTSKDALSFIYNNVEYLLNKDIDISSKMHFICNNNDVYALLIINGDEYDWSIYKNQEFLPINKKEEENDLRQVEKSDYIVEMMVGIGKSSKIRKIVPEIENMNTEGQIKTLKKIGLNSRGYHLK